MEQIAMIYDIFQPDVVHFHHYFFFGLDSVALFKSKGASVVLTLHEYALICNHNGQMVKANSLRLCHASSPAECSSCFPEISSGKFFLREMLIKQLVAHVDGLVSPSNFLRDRYIAWGVAPKRIRTIENLLPLGFPQGGQRASNVSKQGQRIRFGYFGQINRYKGANILLGALKHLSADTLSMVEIVVFGARLEEQPDDFRVPLEKQLDESAANVSFFGPYRNEDMPDLLGRVDWLVIPSIWWENSPLVILEGRAAGIPILTSNIGGMAEKVRDGVDGIHFLAGSSLDCAAKIQAIVDGLHVEAQPIDATAHSRDGLQQHVRLYQSAIVGDRAQ